MQRLVHHPNHGIYVSQNRKCSFRKNFMWKYLILHLWKYDIFCLYILFLTQMEYTCKTKIPDVKSISKKLENPWRFYFGTISKNLRWLVLQRRIQNSIKHLKTFKMGIFKKFWTSPSWSAEIFTLRKDYCETWKKKLHKHTTLIPCWKDVIVSTSFHRGIHAVCF